ncbi:hypothetical protein M422DRAFT_193189 [Sphaerobolus stellatus SS14]|uniref:Probable acetate kinase n=1 Tax=Sphaerobolus stellatus (strain SS14) TaxID=990650 RepID=A0A0C9UJU9_SPHS4|nr:hypothetical protein M422DRAFT_193189 [Sphaerobolus stellatus SS14]
MPPLILAVNAGSSSLKLAVFRSDEQQVSLLATGSLSSVGSPPAKFSYALASSPDAKRKSDAPRSVQTHTDAFEYFLHVLFDDERFTSEGHTREHITHICHRVVHGGRFTKPVVIEQDTYDRLAALSDLAPLHNNRALDIIRSCHDSLPNALSIAFFDSAFHSTLEPHIYTYSISPTIAKEKNLRKYGFHGLSYAFILRSVSSYLHKPLSEISIIALHLGSGASVCAIRNGQSVNTSMGLTPVSGLPGGTRAGDVDPSLIFHYTADAHNVGRMSADATRELHITEAEKILNMESGWKALTGTADFHEIATSDKLSHKLAFDILVDRVCQFVGGYFVQLEGKIDALVFAGGLGENSPELRKAILDRCACLGIDTVDPKKNSSAEEHEGPVYEIGMGGTRIRALVCETNEEVRVLFYFISLLTLTRFYSWKSLESVF